MTDIDRRLDKLSPAKRRLLEQLLDKKRKAAAAEDAIINEGDFAFDGDKLRDKEEVRRFYDSVSRQLNQADFARFSIFLNYGYVPNDNPQHSPVELPAQTLNKNTTRLILELIGDCELTPQSTLLDVGCGRGGTIRVIREHFEVGSVMGVDLAPAAIEFCRQTHTYANTRFEIGDAENLPVEDRSIDVVTNVESSHCYPNIGAFYTEVRRVLRPQGRFLYTDLIATEELSEHRQMLKDSGFVIEHRRDITSNVLLSCDETAARNARAFSDANDSGIMGNFLGLPDTGLYSAMKNGYQKYMLYRFCKQL